MSQRPNPSRRNTARSNEQLPSEPTSRSQTGDASSSSRRISSRHNESENNASNNASKPLSPSSIAPPPQPAQPLFRMPQFGGSHNPQLFGQQGNFQPAIAGGSQRDLGGYGFPPGGPVLWDWNSNMEFPDFASFYEPQGQLAAQSEMQPQQSFLSDFNTPYHLMQDASFLSTAAAQPTAAPFPATLSHGESAPPQMQTLDAQLTTKPRPSISDTSAPSPTTRAGVKRKADSDSGPAGTPANLTVGGAAPAAKRVSMSKPPSQQVQPTPSRPPSTRNQSAAQILTSAAPQSQASRSQASSNASSPTSIAPPPAAESSNSSSKRPSEQGPKTATAEKPGATETASTATKKPATETRGGTLDNGKVADIPKFASVLPAGKVFPIQIGSELFRLSGASISSDAPSYFSHYFGEQLLQTNGRASAIKTLYIDRDPQTFRDIALHLQGYHVKPRDGEHFVRLFADAQFYSLPRFTQQLFKSEIYIQVGTRHFKIPREIFASPGDSPNYFSLGFAHFFSTPSEVFPGLDRQTLLRPPSILPPAVPNRNGDVFADILKILQGYTVKSVVRNEGHRAELLRDARYFHLKGVEQKLIPCSISYNLLRERNEIILRLGDIRQSGVGFHPDPETTHVFNPPNKDTSKPATPLSNQEASSGGLPTGFISYQRPYVDDAASDLIVEISSPEIAAGSSATTRLDLHSMRATFLGQTKARIASLFQVVANKLNLPAMVPLGLMLVNSGGGVAAQPVSPANSGVSGDRVRIRIEQDAWIEVDGGVLEWEEVESPAPPRRGELLPPDRLPPVKKWRRLGGREEEAEEPFNPNLDWVVRRGHWRLRVEGSEDDMSKVEVVMCAVKIEAYTCERVRNGDRRWLGG